MENFIFCCIVLYVFETPQWLLKGHVRYIFAILFFKSERKVSTLETRKSFLFISLQKLFSLLRYSNFRVLESWISWRDQIGKQKTRNTFYCITLVVNNNKNFHQKILQKMWRGNKFQVLFIFIKSVKRNLRSSGSWLWNIFYSLSFAFFFIIALKVNN